MKNWIIDFSLLYMDGRVQEVSEEIMALSIWEAMDYAEKKIRAPFLQKDDIRECVIWGVCIVEDDVF